MTKTLLFMFTHSPYSGSHAREGLEALLAAAAFDQNPAVIFLGEGIWQLIEQGDSAIYKAHGKMLKALPLYGVEHIYVEGAALLARGLAASSLIIPAEVMDLSDITQKISGAGHILSF